MSAIKKTPPSTKKEELTSKIIQYGPAKGPLSPPILTAEGWSRRQFKEKKIVTPKQLR